MQKWQARGLLFSVFMVTFLPNLTRVMFSNLRIGDEVAVMPAIGADPSETMEIVRATYVGAVMVQVADGRTFANSGRCLNNIRCIEPVTDEHRRAIKHTAG